MKHGKRILSLLLVLLMVTGCLSGLSLTASAYTSYDLWVGDVQVNDDNRNDVLGDGSGGTGSVSFDPNTKTLYLNNATITPGGGIRCIEARNLFDLTIELSGTNTLNGMSTAYYGIQAECELHIRGSGTLTIQDVTINGIDAGNWALDFDDPDDADRPTVNVTAPRFGIVAGEVNVYNAEIHAATTAENESNISYCKTAAILAYHSSTKSWGTIRIGKASDILHENNVLIEASNPSTSNGDHYAVASGGTFTLASTAAVTSPANTTIDSYAYTGSYTVLNSENRPAKTVTITAVPHSAGYAEYPLSVGGVTVSTDNKNDVLGDGTVSYDPDANVLSLNNATITGSANNTHILYNGYDVNDAVLTVDLTGTNTVGSANGNCFYGIETHASDLRFTGGGTLSVYALYDAINCLSNDIFFDDPAACPSVTVTAGRFGIWTDDLTMYQGNLTATSTCAKPMNDSQYNGYRAAGILAIGTVTVGDGTMDATKNNVHLTASCSQAGTNYAPLFAKTAINLPARTTTITTPTGGYVGGLNGGYTVYDGNGERVTQVVIDAQPAAPLEYGVWLNGAELTEVNLTGGIAGLAFDPATGILHVTGNVTLDQPSGANGADCAIYSTLSDLILDIDEGCTLTLSGRAYGIYALGSVHIHNGALTVTGAQTGVLCDGGSLYFDGEDTAKQPAVTVAAAQNAIAADSVYLWNVDLQATVTGAPGTGESAADYAAIRAAGTASGSGVVRFGESGAAAWKNNTTVNVSATLSQAIYAVNGLTVSNALAIRQPADCMPYTGDTTLRHLADGTPATAVRIGPRDANAATYDIWIGEVQVTEDSRSDILGDGTVIYVPGQEANTLYLKNAAYVSEIDQLSTYIRYEESTPLILRLEGENSFRNDVYYFHNAATGIECSTAELHIVGSGSLDMIARSIGVECGDDHCLWFDDQVNRPTLNLQASDALHAKSIYMDRVELHAVCSTGASTENASQRIWLYAAIRAEGNGADSGVLRIGKDGGTDNVLLDISISTLYEEKYRNKVFALYAKNDLILPDNETVVTPLCGGVLHETDKHTIIKPTNENADHIRIEPRAVPQQVESYALWLNGYQVNRQNKNDLPGLNGSWFDSYSSTLHLTGAGTLQAMVVNSKGCGIYSELPELTIVLEEDCDLEVTSCSYGIYMAEDCDLHIRGGGSLQVPDARLGGIILNGDGDLYFDGQNPELRPRLNLHAEKDGLLARDIHFWNVDLYLSANPGILDHVILASRSIDFGSDTAGEEWKNNAVVYAACHTLPAILAMQDLTVSAEETVWLPNNAEIADYNGRKTFKDPNYRPAGSWPPAPAIFVSPKLELPSGEALVRYDLWVNGIQVTSLNQDMIPGLGGSWYDPVTTTLHLSGKLYLDYTTNSPDGAVIDTRLNCLTIQLDYAQVYINTSAEPGEEENVNAYGIYGSHDIIVQGDGRITVANADNTALYAGRTLTLGPGPAPNRSDYAYAIEYAEAYETWQSNLRLIPEVNVYSRTYGIRCSNLKMEAVKLNSIIYATHNVGTASVAGHTVPNAAVLVTGTLDLGTSTGEFYRNAVTAPELSCSFKQDEGYAIYAGTIRKNSDDIEFIKPVACTIHQDGHYLVSSDSPVQVTSIGTQQETFYEITVEQPEDGFAGLVSLDTIHADGRARAFDTVTVTASMEPDYTMTRLSVVNEDIALNQTLSTTTDTFTMPEANVTIRSEVGLYGHEILVDDMIENGTVTADRSRAKQGDLVTLTVSPDPGYELDGFTVTDENDSGVVMSGSQFTMPNSAVTVTATFRKIVYSITLDCGENGTLSAVPSAASYGDTVTLTVTPNARYQRDMLIVTDEKGRRVDVDNDEFIMPAADVTVTVRFAPILFDITILESEHVRIEADTLSAQEGTTVHLTSYGEAYVVNATAPIIVDGAGNPVAVTLDDSPSAERKLWSFTMPESDVTITPTYEYIYYGVSTYYYISHGTVMPQPDRAHPGETITVTVTPDEGYALTSLSYHNQSLVNSEYPITQTNGVYSFTMPAGSVMIFATFSPVDYTITVSQTVNGSVTAPATARFGDTVTLNVTPDQGYELTGLSYSCSNGEPVPIQASEGVYSFSMPSADVTVTATFTRTPIPYVDALGNAMTPITDYTPLTSETTALPAGWWVVSGEVTNANRLTVTGSVNLLLCDSAMLTVPAGIEVLAGNSLTIWVQSHADRTGALSANADDNNAAIGGGYDAGSVTINGGIIEATGGRYGAGIGGGVHSRASTVAIHAGIIRATGGSYAAGIGGGANNNWSGHYGHASSVTITGGQITATGSWYGAGIGGGGGTSSSGAGNVGNIEITGGQITATSPNGYGIGPGRGSSSASYDGTVSGTITFGWTETTDFIQSSKNYSAEKLAFADGKWFLIDGSNTVATTSNIQSSCKLVPLLDQTLIPHALTIDDSITNGTVEADVQTAMYQDLVTLTVTPDAGYALANLTVTDEYGDPVAVANGQFTMPACSVTVTASFTAIDYTVTLTQTAGGTISASGDLTHAHIGDVVTLTAEPATGYELTGWIVTDTNGAIEVENGSFTMPASDVTVTATFTLKDYEITFEAVTGGTASANPNPAHMGDTVTLTAALATGYELTGWTVTGANGEIEVTNGSFTMPASDITVTPVFALTDYAITFTDVTGGTASANPNPAHLGESVTLTAEPATGYELSGYTVTGASGAIEVMGGSFTMPASDVTVTPIFTAIDYTITLTQASGGTVSISGDPDHAHVGDTFTLTATPDTGYELTGYAVSGADVTVDLTSGSFTMPAADITVTPTFALKNYEIAFANVTGGTASANPNPAHMGDAVTLTATPAAGYRFDCFTVTDEAGRTVALATENTFVMPASDVTVTPGFTAIDYTIAVLPADNGTVTASKTVANVNDEITFAISPAEGYVLQKLTVYDFSYNTYAVSGNTLVMPAANLIVVASFTRAPYRITVAPTAHGSVTANQDAADAGTRITLTVEPADGYALGSLTVTDADGQSIPVQNHQFTMPASDVTVTATFAAEQPPANSETYFVGNSLTLEGEIGVNFYVKLNDVASANARVVFTWGTGTRAQTRTDAFTGLDADTSDRYKLTVRVAAAQMTDTITAKLYDGETLVDTQQYSVAEYARYVVGASDATLLPLCQNNQTKVDNLRALCRSMLIYGAKSQLQFKYNTYALADQGLVYTLETPGTLGTTVFPDGFADACGIAFYGASLVLDSTTTYRLYFTVTDQTTLDNLTVKLGDDTLTYGTKDGMVYFDVADIAAAYVFKDHSLTFGSTSVTANAGAYGTGVLGGSNETLKDAVKALYAYSEAAKTFFGVQ